jgi:threonine dehydratase
MSGEERARGIVAASAGNHAQGVALAATTCGAKVRIVMPEYAPLTKREATESYGAQVILHGESYDDAFHHARALADESGHTLVHAFDDEWVMAGQGTIGLEILEQQPDVRAVVCPVGGGGLISGVAVAIKSQRPDVKIIGVQAAGAASAVASFHDGERKPTESVNTIADGIKVQHVGERCYDYIQQYVDQMVTVRDTTICEAMLALDEHAHIAAEPAAAVPVAALLEGSIDLPDGPAVAVVSGGNIDTFEKMRYIRRALVEERRHLRIRVRLLDRRGSKPRKMEQIFRLLAEHRLNVLDIAYRRDTPDLPMGVVQVEFHLETRGRNHAAAVQQAIEESGIGLP